jgi:hypothetical protein
VMRIGADVERESKSTFVATLPQTQARRSVRSVLRHVPVQPCAIDRGDGFVCGFPTIGFVQLYVLVIVRLARCELAWINVMRHPTAEWIAQQITEAFPWNDTPRYLVRDRDGIYGAAVTRRLRATGIRDTDRARIAMTEWVGHRATK